MFHTMNNLGAVSQLFSVWINLRFILWTTEEYCVSVAIN